MKQETNPLVTEQPHRSEKAVQFQEVYLHIDYIKN